MNTVWERKESLSYKSGYLFLTRRSETLRRAGWQVQWQGKLAACILKLTMQPFHKILFIKQCITIMEELQRM